MAAGMNNLDVFEVLLGAAGVILAGLLLWGLHKKLKLFTKGSITFMTVVLMLVAFESIVEHLNDIRNAESSARERARTSAKTTFLRSWLEGDEADALALCAVDDRDAIATALRDSQRSIALLTQQTPTTPETLPWASVVSFDFEELYDFASHEWRNFSAICRTADDRYIQICGNLNVSHGDEPQVVQFSNDITAKVVDARIAAREFWEYACVYRNDQFVREFPRPQWSR